MIPLLRDDDWITSTYRNHGHSIARGVPLEAIASEIYGKADGVCGGKGGSMHAVDQSRRMIGGMGIVAAGLPIAAGAAFGSALLGGDQVAVAFFGDGAVHQGAWHEALDFASMFKAPVIFVCENNLYAETTAVDYHLRTAHVADMAVSYGMEAETIDGMDVRVVRDSAARAIARARAGGGPFLLEAMTYRYSGQYEGDTQTYKPPEEVAYWRERDPVTAFREVLATEYGLANDELDRLKEKVAAEVESAFEHGRNAEWPALSTLTQDVYTVYPDGVTQLVSRPLKMKDAINEALRQAMEDDDSVVLLGEDIAGGAGRDEDYPEAADAWGGPFGVTKGLLPRFGRRRVIDTVIAETGFIGASIGMALAGLRPVAEIMYADFIGTSYDQLLNQAAKLRYMYGGKVSVPMVVRTVTGAGFRAAGEHSQTLYSLYAHIPGLKVVAPAFADDAKGLLLSAIDDPDPVIFMEHKRLYMTETDVPERPVRVPLGQARICREGADVTIVGVQKMVHTALDAAEMLAAEGIEAEVIDPRTYSPLDTTTILGSVARTGRLVVVDESYPRCSLATDISSLVAENAFESLRAPIRTVTAPHAPVPFSPVLEDAYIPQPDKVAEAVRFVVGY